MLSLEDFCQKKISLIEAKGLLRNLYTVNKPGYDSIVYKQGKKLISFSCNDYLCLANHPLVKKSAIAAINNYGVGSGSSRMITGNHELYKELEGKLAKYHSKEAALVFSSGYLTNLGIISTLLGREDMIIADKLVHSSIIEGIQLSKAKLYRFAHNDLENFQELLCKYRNLHRHCLVIAECVYSMDGDIAPIVELITLAKEFQAWTLIDYAHSIGIVKTCNDNPDIHIGTLSKIMGSLGGYVCSSKVVIDYLQTKVKSFIYTTSLPPSIVAAAITALDLIEKYKDIPLSLAKHFCKILNLPQPQSYIVPIIMNKIEEAMRAQKILEEHGFLVIAIRPPTVPTPRLRLTFTAKHTVSEVEKLCSVFKQHIFSKL